MNRGFVYEQTTGRLLLRSGEQFSLIALGYAGAPGYVNDPNKDHLRKLGPLPRGHYRIIKRKHPRFKDPAFFLAPFDENRMFGRSGFWIHGDNMQLNRSASSGCIVLERPSRLAIDRWFVSFGVDRLEVVR